MATMYSSETVNAVISSEELKGTAAVMMLQTELEIAGVPSCERDMFVAEKVMEELRLGHLTEKQAAWMLRGYLEGSVAQAFRVGVQKGEFTDLLHAEVAEMLYLVSDDVEMKGQVARIRAAWEARTA